MTFCLLSKFFLDKMSQILKRGSHFRANMTSHFDIRRFDIYRKVPKDLTNPTNAGAVVSIVGVSVILFLFTSELIAFLTPELVSSVYVGDTAHEQIRVYMQITLTEQDCEDIGINTSTYAEIKEVPVTGNVKPDIKKFAGLTKTVTEDGKGCHLKAFFHIDKPSGKFNVVNRAENGNKVPSFKHVIHHLRFGNPVGGKIQHVYGVKDCSFEPLDNINYTDSFLSGKETYNYHLKIVPSLFYDGGGHGGTYTTYQFTATPKKLDTDPPDRTPAIWFNYQLTPLTVKYTLKEKPWYHFMTTVCAIVGGTFTVAGIIDSLVFSAHEMYKKMN